MMSNSEHADAIRRMMNGNLVRVPQALYDELPPELQAVCQVVKPMQITTWRVKVIYKDGRETVDDYVTEAAARRFAQNVWLESGIAHVIVSSPK